MAGRAVYRMCAQLCLTDCLTKGSAKGDELIRSVATGIPPNDATHPPVKAMVQKSLSWSSGWLAAHTAVQPLSHFRQRTFHMKHAISARSVHLKKFAKMSCEPLYFLWLLSQCANTPEPLNFEIT